MKFLNLVCLLFLVGCNQPKIIEPLFELSYVDSQQAVLLIVQSDTLSYGGGLNAIEGITTWSGKLDNEQLPAFQKLLAKSDWLKQSPKTAENVGDNQYLIHIREGAIDNTFALSLKNKHASEMYDFLYQISLTRLESHLNTLPKPNMDVIIERKLKQE